LEDKGGVIGLEIDGRVGDFFKINFDSSPALRRNAIQKLRDICRDPVRFWSERWAQLQTAKPSAGLRASQLEMRQPK